MKILTSNIDGDETPKILIEDQNTLEVEYDRPILANNSMGFKSVPLPEGEKISADGFTATVMSASGGGVKRLRFRMEKPLNDSILLVYDKKEGAYSKIISDYHPPADRSQEVKPSAVP